MPATPVRSIREPGAPVSGRIEAVFRLTGATLSVASSTTPPLELRGPFYSDSVPDEGPRYFLRNVTAGVFAGDHLEVRLRAEAGARVRIQPTSATRVHESRGARARVDTHIEVAPAARVVFDAGTTILQQNADLEQTTELVLAAGGTLHHLEVLTLGRLASGERLAFRRFASRLTARTSEGATLFRERYELTPAAAPALLEAALGGASIIGTLLVLGRTPSPDPALFEQHPAVFAGLSALPRGEGFILRALGARAEPVRRLLEAALAVSMPPPTGVDAPPRNRVQ